MGPDFFLPTIWVSIAVSVVAFVALVFAASQDAKQGARTEIIKRVYVYLVSFLTLMLIVSAVASLLNVGLRSSVLRSADPAGTYSEPPPSLYFYSAKPVDAPTTEVTCADGCSLTDEMRTQLTQWEQDYRNWQERQKPSIQRTNALVTPLSFLIVAGIVFVFHWRLARRDQAGEEDRNLTRTTYFSAVSFVSLLAMVVSAGFLLNTVLRVALPGASTNNRYGGPTPVELGLSPDSQLLTSIKDCRDQCEVSAETIALIDQWQQDYTKWDDRQQSALRERHNELANELSFLIVAIPLFWIHWRRAWRRRPTPPPATT